MNESISLPTQPQNNDALVDQLLDIEENAEFESKRVVGDKLTRALESIVAFANTEGGFLILGLEDEQKAKGRDRVYGIQENVAAVDELKRLVAQRITPALALPGFVEIGCTLHDGTPGSIVIVRVNKSPVVHSIVLNGTWKRLSKGNRELVAEEITRLSMERGAISAESQLVGVPFPLLETDIWRLYARQRKLTRPIAEAMTHIGLAKEDASGALQPTRAAVLLFAEEPGGLLASKASIRVFHYKGERIEHQTTPNLLKPPESFVGPLLLQIQRVYDYVLRELATGVQMGPLGFEVVQRYPTRVIKEAITNAVIHRDYSIPADVQIRIFADRIEIESPGVFPGGVTAANIARVGSFNRNPLIVSNLREFPDPPNLDAGEGVPMMFQTMDAAGLYPPLYLTRATTRRDNVLVVLFNENRPSVWDQVSEYLVKNGSIANAEVRQILRTDDALKASKLLKAWVDRGLLVVTNPQAARQHRRYRRAEGETVEPLFSRQLGKQS